MHSTRFTDVKPCCPIAAALVCDDAEQIVVGGDRRCFRENGAPKRWYASLTDARRVARRPKLAEEGNHVYPCPSGEGWHIGRAIDPALRTY